MIIDNSYSNDAFKKRASLWFESLRDELSSMLEGIEEDALVSNVASMGEPGRFKPTNWHRNEEDNLLKNNDGGGGTMSLMRGRVFEKAGVNISTVWGEFSEEYSSFFSYSRSSA